MTKQFFEVNGSFRGFHDITRTFESLKEAEVAEAEMKRDGLHSVEILYVIETEYFRYAESV